MVDYVVHKYRKFIQTLVVVFLCVFVIIAINQIFEDPTDEIFQLMSYGVYAIILMFFLALFGYIEKSIIDVQDGRWTKDNQ